MLSEVVEVSISKKFELRAKGVLLGRKSGKNKLREEVEFKCF